MTQQLKFKIRNEGTLDYMIDHGEFINVDSPSENIFTAVKVGQYYNVQHQATKMFLHANGLFLEQANEDYGFFDIVKAKSNKTGPIQYLTHVPLTENAKSTKNPEPVRWILEETTDEQITFVTCGASENLSDDELFKTRQLAHGGEPLAEALEDAKQQDKDGMALQKHLAEFGEQAWANYTIEEGGVGAIAVKGSASISVNIHSAESAKGRQLLSKYQRPLDVHLNENEEDAIVGLAEVEYINGKKTTTQTLVMLGEAALLGGLVYQVGRSILVAGLSSVGNWIAETRLVSALDRAISRSILASMRSGRYFAALRTLGARTLLTTLRIVGPVLNFAAVSVALAVIALVIIPFFFKNQKATVRITNYSKKQLLMNLAHTDNVPESAQDNTKETPYTIPAFIAKGDKTTVTIGGRERTVIAENNIIHYQEFTFGNKRNFAEGFDVLMQVSSEKNYQARRKSLFISTDIPWIADNTINLKVDDYSANAEKLTETMIQKYKKLTYPIDDQYKATIGISALSGGKDNSYMVQVDIEDIND